MAEMVLIMAMIASTLGRIAREMKEALKRIDQWVALMNPQESREQLRKEYEFFSKIGKELGLYAKD